MAVSIRGRWIRYASIYDGGCDSGARERSSAWVAAQVCLDEFTNVEVLHVSPRRCMRVPRPDKLTRRFGSDETQGPRAHHLNRQSRRPSSASGAYSTVSTEKRPRRGLAMMPRDFLPNTPRLGGHACPMVIPTHLLTYLLTHEHFGLSDMGLTFKGPFLASSLPLICFFRLQIASSWDPNPHHANGRSQECLPNTVLCHYSRRAPAPQEIRFAQV
ncbi:hypothetical protein COCMIDRAFT_21733 [Bipolaris oryzae ATCC 44560]|uniref:Uncharacterized protein n=1 Tax=Bipolaris oryzae ATCC 44560 TaxID=930090 RepID=W6ZKY8_COCMI|nr:uncharacterized protein COCMIDRAFT_21733 [Bipolaris oryzae ATCC 44560]EUC50715.1 hypothetical protein COCMIDRAFT_21733 [Bipolaris oryzae ATCC 44560]